MTVALRSILATYFVLAGSSLAGIAVDRLAAGGGDLVSARGAAAFAGAAAALIGAAVLIREWRRRNRVGRHALWLGCAAGVVSALVLVGIAEAMLRIATTETDGISSVGDIRVPPTWSDIVARNRRLIARASPDGRWRQSYLVFDPDLGWVVGDDRESADGAYRSGYLGIRSRERGFRPATGRAVRTIVVVGDSNAFSLEVDFEDSWASRLDRALGPDVQVLNFGVNGYGLDQAVLRYERDAQPLAPDLVILAFIHHDLVRSMVVYTAIDFPTWQMPFAKPRLRLTPEGLDTTNTPLPDPTVWLTASGLDELPHGDLDFGIRTGAVVVARDRASMLERLLLALLPAYPAPELITQVNAETVELNASLFRRFAGQETASMLVYVPTEGGGDFDAEPRDNLARAALALAAQPYVDLTSCLAALSGENLYVPSGNHYSPMANARIAECLEPEVRRRLR